MLHRDSRAPARPEFGARLRNGRPPSKEVPALNDYELMFILAPDLEEEAVATTTERVKSYVTSRGGEVRSLEPWGRRRLAYPIQRYHEGAYHIAQLTLGSEHAIELDHSLKLNEQVLRYMIVRLD